MKLTDFLQDVGRPVAYYPELRKITGSVTATILLCQFIYWRGKESGQDGWLYKTAEDIQAETGLSYGEQKTARRDLVSAGLLDEHYARLDHQMRFKVNLDAINEKWGMIETEIPESGKPQFGNDEKPLSLNESEITAENTQPEDISEPDQKQGTAYNRGEQERPSAVDEWLKMANMPGAKDGAKIDALLSAFGVAFVVNSETAEWKKFAKYAISEQKLKGWEPERFIKWVKAQKGYPEFWSCRRMMGEYPKAFINDELSQQSESYRPRISA